MKYHQEKFNKYSDFILHYGGQATHVKSYFTFFSVDSWHEYENNIYTLVYAGIPITLIISKLYIHGNYFSPKHGGRAIPLHLFNS